MPMNSELTSERNYHAGRDTSTFLFAPEIECALIAIAWREPDRLATVKRELDPAVHFIQPHCRWLLEAVDLAYRELGTVEFASVIQVLRELRRLEDVGGLEGAAQVWREGEFLESPIWQATGKTEFLFAEYLGMLKTYAVSRKLDPPRPTYRFTGGNGVLYLDKTSAKQDRYKGEVSVAGTWYSVGAEVGPEGEFINLRFEPKR